VEEYDLKISATDSPSGGQTCFPVNICKTKPPKPPSEQWTAKLATLDARMKKLEATIVLITEGFDKN
jgi:hypothetical protein